MSTASASTQPLTGSVYSWRMAPRRLGFLVPQLVVSYTVPLLGFLLAFVVGAPLVTVWLGLFVMVLGLLVSRVGGTLELTRLRWAGEQALPQPTWRRRQSAKPTRLRRILGPIRNPDYWRYVAHGFVGLIVTPITWSFTIAALVLTLALPTYGVFVALGKVEYLHPGPGELLKQILGSERVAAWGLSPDKLTVIAYSLASFVGILLLPLICGLGTRVHFLLARVFLARTRSDRMAEQVEHLDRSRRAATQAEGRELRRLERDLHDGPQQQLLRLQMDLDQAGRRIATDPEEARRLMDEARARVGDTLSELRRLSKGIAPPLLQDRGVEAALCALAERNPVATSVEVEPGSLDGLDPATQQGLYFVASELYANTVKHADAAHIDTTVRRRRTDDRTDVEMTVTDDGRGGAGMIPGGGLEGLGERVDGLGGTFAISSPAGGPTTVTVTVPLS